MLTALNLLKITTLFGLGFFYFLGLGWVIIGIFLKPTQKQVRLLGQSFTRLLPLLLVTGIIVNYGISLLIQRLPLGMIITAFVSVIGLWNLGRECIKRKFYFPNYQTIKIWIGASLLFLLYLVPILFEPLDLWDARSIWFFHAKMIYFAESFGVSAGWQHPSALLSHVDYPMHVDYPKLVPGIAAQIAHVSGFWNEYIPKASLGFILFPALLWLFSFERRSFSFLTLIVLPLSLSTWLWNGYMDGYFALYFAISMLLLGRYIQDANPIDLLSSFVCMILLLNLKNEGQLAFLAGCISITIVLYINRIRPITLIQIIPAWKIILSVTIIFLPFAIWFYYKQRWGLSNDLNIGTEQSLARILERFNDKLYILIFQQTLEKINGGLLLLGFLIFASIAQQVRIPLTTLPAFTSSTIYYCGIFLIYMMTPHDLDWHLITSANRTMLSIHGATLVNCYYILDSLEN